MSAAFFVWLGLLDFGTIGVVSMPILISVIYFLFATDKRPLSRVFRSAHGLLFVLAFAYAVKSGPSADDSLASGQAPFFGLFALGLASLLYSAWREARWYLHFLHILTVSYAAIILYRTGLGTPATPVEADCWLPELVLDLEAETRATVGDEGDRRHDSCPVPLPRVIHLDRPYGSVRFEWWGSPHKLFLAGSNADGAPLQFDGEGILPNRDSADTWLDQYSHYRVFPGEDFVDTDENLSLNLEIRTVDGVDLEGLALTYTTRQCRCRSAGN